MNTDMNPPSSTPPAPGAFPGDLKGPKPITVDEVAIVADPTPHLADYINRLHIIDGPNGRCMCGTDGKTCQELLAEASQEVRDALLMFNLAPPLEPVAVVPPETPECDALRKTVHFPFDMNPEFVSALNLAIRLERRALAAERERDEAREKMKETAKDFETAFRLVRQENTHLSESLACITAKREREKAIVNGVWKTHEKQFAEQQEIIAALTAKLTTAEAELAEEKQKLDTILYDVNYKGGLQDWQDRAFKATLAGAEMLKIVEELRAELAEARAEIVKANAQAERFEREWYLRGDEIERLQLELAARQPLPSRETALDTTAK